MYRDVSNYNKKINITKMEKGSQEDDILSTCVYLTNGWKEKSFAFPGCKNVSLDPLSHTAI